MKHINKYIFRTTSMDTFASVGLLLLRIVTGFSMILHATPKMSHPMSWLGDSVPAIMQLLAFTAEFGGGFFLILGLLTPVVTLGIFSTMFVAVKEHFSWGDSLYRLTISNSNEGAGIPWMGLPQWLVVGGGHSPAGSGSAELAMLFFIITFAFFFTGPGRYSFDDLIARKL